MGGLVDGVQMELSDFDQYHKGIMVHLETVAEVYCPGCGKQGRCWDAPAVDRWAKRHARCNPEV